MKLRWNIMDALRRGFGALLLLAAFAGAAGPSPAGAAQLSVRLAEASGGDGGVDASLRDVEGLLRGNLPFKEFRLVDQKALRLPVLAAAGVLNLQGGFVLRCSGDVDRLALTLDRDGQVLIQTMLALHPGRPIVLGGFPSARGKLLLVLTVR